MEIRCNYSLFFRPYGRKFIPIYMLFSVHMDGNLQLNLAIFCPYGRKFTAKILLFSVRTNTDSADGATLLSKVLAQTN